MGNSTAVALSPAAVRDGFTSAGGRPAVPIVLGVVGVPTATAQKTTPRRMAEADRL
jgi:hypothetical protein